MKKTWLAPVWNQFKQALETKSLVPASLLVGAAGLGKTELLSHLAKVLLCERNLSAACGVCHSCQLVAAGTHPELRTLGDTQAIKVDDVRELNAWASKRASIGQAKVAVLFNCEQLNPAAANALLKTLEEPNSQLYFLLAANQLEAVLPTIRSRCQLVKLAAPAQQQVRSGLSSSGYSLGEEFALAYQLCQGNPKALERLYQQGAEQAINDFISLMEQGELNALCTTLANEEGKLSWFMSLLSLLLKQSRLSLGSTQPQLLALGQRFTSDQVNTAYQAVLDLKRQLAETPNLNLSMQLKPILIKLYQTS